MLLCVRRVKIYVGIADNQLQTQQKIRLTRNTMDVPTRLIRILWIDSYKERFKSMQRRQVVSSIAEDIKERKWKHASRKCRGRNSVRFSCMLWNPKSEGKMEYM